MNRTNRVPILLLVLVIYHGELKSQANYEEFIASRPKRKLAPSELKNHSDKQQQVYEQSRLYKFQQNDTTTLPTVWSFYTNVIKQEYAGQEHYDFLLSKFLSFAIRGFDLRLRESPEATRQLIVYTKELVNLRTNYDVQFSYSCIVALKDVLPGNEINDMVKIERFKVRLWLENINQSLIELENNPPKNAREKKSSLEFFNKLLADFQQLDANFAALLN